MHQTPLGPSFVSVFHAGPVLRGQDAESDGMHGHKRVQNKDLTLSTKRVPSDRPKAAKLIPGRDSDWKEQMLLDGGPIVRLNVRRSAQPAECKQLKCIMGDIDTPLGEAL